MVRDALVEVLRRDLKGVDLGMTSITGVDVSPDLHFARVYVSGLKEDDTRAVVEQLQNARGAARRFLGQRIRLRYTPELDFKFDETSMRAGRIEDLLHEIGGASASAPAETNDEADEGEPEEND
jgi:ribosome-binding factor A